MSMHAFAAYMDLSDRTISKPGGEQLVPVPESRALLDKGAAAATCLCLAAE